MVDHTWSVLCARSVIDSESNSISLIDVIEEVQVTILDPVQHEAVQSGAAKTALPIPTELVTMWSRGPDDAPARGRGRMVLEQPNGKSITSAEHDIDLTTHKRLRHRHRNPSLPFVGAGKYVFRVQVKDEGEADAKWRDVAAIPLVVVTEASPAPEPGAAPT